MEELRKSIKRWLMIQIIGSVGMVLIQGTIVACNWDRFFGDKPRVETQDTPKSVSDMSEPDVEDMKPVTKPGLIVNSPGARIESSTNGNRIVNSPGAVIRNRATINGKTVKGWGKFTITKDGTVKDVPPPWEEHD